MHRYQMDVLHYFRGHETFEISGEDRADAVKNGKAYIARKPGGNYQLESVKCVKKLKEK